MPNLPSISIPPETPRAKAKDSNASNLGSVNRNILTPSFSFGLNFSPSFNFNSPSIQAISPGNFLHISNSFNKAINRTPITSASSALVPPSTGKKHNRFLEALTRSSQQDDENNKEEDNVSDKENNDEIWSTINTSQAQHNSTNQTSMYEDENDHEKDNSFLRPNKLELKKIEENKKSPSLDRAADISPKTTSDNHVVKKRKLSTDHGVTDSPNNSVASKIDSTMQSPTNYRKQSVAYSTKSNSSSATNADDKVWWPELDDVLIKSLYKYKKFKEDQDSFDASSILKKTSQNKIISRMLLNKTGVLRTTKQISSRIFRLSKSGKLVKETKTPQTGSFGNNDLDSILSTPLRSLVNARGSIDSIKLNTVIDEELDMLLGTSPINDEFDDTSYKLEIRDFRLSFRSVHDHHIFTNLVSIDVNKSLSVPIEEAIRMKLESKKVPAWIINHDLNLNCHHIASSTPCSTATASHQFQQSHLNLTGGNFESHMTLDVSCGEKSQRMLSWRSYIVVYKKGSKLLEVVDVINGYFSESSKSYTLQIPFLKNFFLGYITYLANGAAITPDENLKIVQIIYSNPKSGAMEFDLDESTVRAYIIHELNMAGTSGSSKINIVDVHSKHQSALKQEHADIDDNETVLADSSPFKLSPNSSRNWDTPSKSRLRIDAKKANVDGGAIAGPLTAPIYNAELLNKKMLDEQEKLKSNLQKDQVRPPLMHSQSVCNVNLSTQRGNSSPEMANNSTLAFSTPMTNRQAPIQNSLVPSSNFTPYQIAQKSFIARTLSESQLQSQVDIQEQSNTQSLPPQQLEGMVNPQIHYVQTQMPSQASTGVAIALPPQVQNQLPQQIVHHIPLQNLGQTGSISQQSFPLVTNNNVITPDNNFMRQQWQQQMYFQQVAQQQFQNNGFHMSTVSGKVQSTKHNSKMVKHPSNPSSSQQNVHNKENIKPRQITFGPILGHDPSRDLKTIKKQNTKNNGIVQCFPANTQIMYKPKK
ncbi:conserved hypothetical protein [Candida dubliniensis CD36]|uniref:TEA domain-containing protein n=1 Tax=Candida dubliniensis (strain CD36 / ATCC MYA-646 / CBS 7987 / NCPF 3949 / NRRL Y-17841) TaxID=573826 RepID=B9W7C6_CANDC|nr:conserved hypothetical protein [Candida dubliniensis CD36]CAX44585.1 conserved hypothetical protein [Candida dubliniensis CD36]